MKNKRGLSGIVTTLIIILLVLAAVGLIWQPISNMLKGGTGALDKSNLCTGIDFKINNAKLASGTSYDLTIERRATGPEQKAGLKVVFSSAVESSDVLDSGATEWEQLKINTINVDSGIPAVNKVTVYPFFTNEETGEEVICEQGFERKISA